MGVSRHPSMLARSLVAALLMSACDNAPPSAPTRPPENRIYTLSGLIQDVTDDTPAGRVPLPGVSVEVRVCNRNVSVRDSWVFATTDAEGVYVVPSLCEGRTDVVFWKNEFEIAPGGDGPCVGDGIEYPMCRWVWIAGDTRYDIRMVRQ